MLRMLLVKKIISKDGGQFRIGLREQPGDTPTQRGFSSVGVGIIEGDRKGFRDIWGFYRVEGCYLK